MKYSLIVCSFSLLFLSSLKASEASEHPLIMEKFSHDRDLKAIESFDEQLLDATYLGVLRCGDQTVGYVHYNIVTQNDERQGHIISWNISHGVPQSAKTVTHLLKHAITELRGLKAETIKVAPLPYVDKGFIINVDNEGKPVLTRLNKLYEELDLIIAEPQQEEPQQDKLDLTIAEQENWFQYACKLFFFWENSN